MKCSIDYHNPYYIYCYFFVGIGEINIHKAMCYLFIDAGLVQLIIEILRFHHDDPVLVYRCLDIMCVLLEVPSLMQPVVEVFMRDMDNLVLIVVLMDRYYHDASVDNADNHVLHESVVDDHSDSDGGTSHMESMACIVYMLSLFVKTGVIRDQLINTYRVYCFYDVLHFMLDRCSDHHQQQQNHHYQQDDHQHHHEQHQDNSYQQQHIDTLQSCTVDCVLSSVTSTTMIVSFLYT